MRALRNFSKSMLRDELPIPSVSSLYMDGKFCEGENRCAIVAVRSLMTLASHDDK
jgi:hypothetical protein